MKILGYAMAAALFILPALSQAAPYVQVGFSPEGSARALVLATIAGARHHIRMLAYAFQAPDIVQALVAVQKRRVEVQMVIDKQRNQGKHSAAKTRAIDEGPRCLSVRLVTA